MNHVQIPPLQDDVNPLLLPAGQPKSLDGLDQQPLPGVYLGTDSTDGSNCVEETEEISLSSSPFSLSVNLPQGMIGSPIYEFSEASEVSIQY